MKTITFSVVLLLAATMIFSSAQSAVTMQDNSMQTNVNNNENTVNWLSSAKENQQSGFEYIPQAVPMPLQPTDWLGYDNGVSDNSLGLTNGGTFEYGIRLTPTELAGYDGWDFTTIRHHHGWAGSTAPSVTGFVKIYDEGTATEPGALLLSDPYTTLAVPGWEDYTLSSAITIDETKDLWVCLEVTHLTGEYPAGMDPGPAVDGKGDWIYLDPGPWQEVQGLGFDVNWLMSAGLEEGGAGPEHDVGVSSIDAPVSGPAGVITPEVTVKNYGNNSEVTDVQLTIGQFAPPATLLSEDFEAGYAGWTVIDGGTSTDTWTDTNPGGRAAQGGCAGTFMIADSDWAGFGPIMDEQLISPSIDCSAAMQVLLDYSHYHYALGNNADVDVSNDGGSTWTTVASYPSTTTGPEIGLDISSVAAGYSDVKIRFHYWNADYAWYWMVDNVEVYQLGGLVNEYDETETSVTIPVGGQVDVSFDDWTPDDWQVSENVDITYGIVATTLLADDNPGNDQKTKSVTMHYPYLHDIELTSVNTPVEDDDAQTFPVQATITNVGQFEECCYKTSVQIGEKVYGSIFFTEDFSVNSWATTHPSNWAKSSSANAGGASPEYRFSWSPSAIADFYLMSPVINTVGYSSATLSFKHYVNDYNGDYDLAVRTSVDGVTWGDVWTTSGGPMGPETVEIAVGGSDGMGSATFQMAFVYIGDSYNINYWYVDDVQLQEVGSTSVEYDEEICVIVLAPGESADLDFPDWTPADLALGISGDIEYVISGESELAIDTNPANNFAAEEFTLTYFHDVKVTEITAPSIGDKAPWDLLFSYDLEAATGALGNAGAEWDGTHFYSTRWAANLIHQFDSTGALVKEFSIPGVTGLRDLAYNEATGYFYGGAAGGSIWEMDFDSETLISTISGGFQSRAIAYNPDDDVIYCSNFGDPMWVVDASSGAILDTITLGVTATYGFAYDNDGTDKFLYIFDQGAGAGTPQYIHQWNLGTGAMTGFTYDVAADFPGTGGIAGGLFIGGGFVPNNLVIGGCLQGTPDNMFVYELRPGGGGGGGYPPITVWIDGGSTAIEAIVGNDGVFEETGLTVYGELYQFIDDPENGTLVWDDSISSIDLDPLGDEQTIPFGSADFDMEGPWGLYIDFPLGSDDYPNNNDKALGIGVDNSEPSTDHTLDPAAPTGLAGWYVSDVTATLTADDGDDDWDSGVAEIKYKIDGGATQTITGFTGSFLITDDGDDVEVEYWAIDNVGNVESPTNTFTIDMDQTVPDIDLSYEVIGGSPSEGWDITFTATATDDTSGMERVDFLINDILQISVPGPGPTYQWTIEYYPLPHVFFKAEAYDIAGNMFYDELEDPVAYVQQLQQKATQKVLIRMG